MITVYRSAWLVKTERCGQSKIGDGERRRIDG